MQGLHLLYTRRRKQTRLSQLLVHIIVTVAQLLKQNRLKVKRRKTNSVDGEEYRFSSTNRGRARQVRNEGRLVKGRFEVKNARAGEEDEEEKKNKKKKKAPYCALENVYSMELALGRTLGPCFPCTQMLWTCGFMRTYDAIAAQLPQKASPPSQSCLLHQHFVPEIQCPTLLLCLSGLLFYTTTTTLEYVSSF